MTQINDWYAARAHRGELDSRFSSDDEIPDRAEFGEVAQRMWSPVVVPAMRRALPKGGSRSPSSAGKADRSWRSAARSWRQQNPDRSYSDCRDALVKAGHLGITRTMIAEFVRQERAETKAKNGKKPAESAKNETRKKQAKAVQPKKVAKSGKPARGDRPAAVEFRPYIAVAPAVVEVVRLPPAVCPGCELVVSDNGYCRCG